MSLATEILAELKGMFLADLRLSLGVLAVVGVAGLLAAQGAMLGAGLVLLLGCLAVLAGAVTLAALRR